jgi:hypothetical protein
MKRSYLVQVNESQHQSAFLFMLRIAERCLHFKILCKHGLNKRVAQGEKTLTILPIPTLSECKVKTSSYRDQDLIKTTIAPGTKI